MKSLPRRILALISLGRSSQASLSDRDLQTRRSIRPPPLKRMPTGLSVAPAGNGKTFGNPAGRIKSAKFARPLSSADTASGSASIVARYSFRMGSRTIRSSAKNGAFFPAAPICRRKSWLSMLTAASHSMSSLGSRPSAFQSSRSIGVAKPRSSAVLATSPIPSWFRLS